MTDLIYWGGLKLEGSLVRACYGNEAGIKPSTTTSPALSSAVLRSMASQSQQCALPVSTHRLQRLGLAQDRVLFPAVHAPLTRTAKEDGLPMQPYC